LEWSASSALSVESNRDYIYKISVIDCVCKFVFNVVILYKTMDIYIAHLVRVFAHRAGLSLNGEFDYFSLFFAKYITGTFDISDLIGLLFACCLL